MALRIFRISGILWFSWQQGRRFWRPPQAQAAAGNNENIFICFFEPNPEIADFNDSQTQEAAADTTSGTTTQSQKQQSPVPIPAFIKGLYQNGEGVLDKETTSHDDLFDAFRMSLLFWH